MKCWFDTEFYEDGRIIDLISIGIISEDGREYYAETVWASHKCQSEWLKLNVRPHLAGEEKLHSVIAREIVEFVGDNPEFWGYYADYDWVALCQLYGPMIYLPRSWPMFCRDVQQVAVQRPDIAKPAQQQEHHALADARWTKTYWERLNRPTGGGDE